MEIGKDITLIEIIEIKIKVDLQVETDMVKTGMIGIGIDLPVDLQGGMIEIIEIMIEMGIIEGIEVTPEKGMTIKRIKEMVKAINTIPT